MSKFLPGFKTVIIMSLVLGVALYQALVGPLPGIDALPGGQSTWSILVPAVALILRSVTNTPLFNTK